MKHYTSPLYRLKELFGIQAKEFYRDFGSVFFSLVFPLFFVIVLIVTNSMSPNFKFEFGVVDPFGNASTRNLVEALSSIEGVAVRSVTKDEADAELKKGKLHAVVSVPKEKLESGDGEIELTADKRYLGFTNMTFEAARAKLLRATEAETPAYRFHTRATIKKVDSDFTFIFPGMLALALLQLGLFATATPLLRARERGTLRYLLLTPLRLHELVICQVGLRFSVAVLQVGLLLGVGMAVLDLGFSDWLAVAAISCLGAIMLIAIGYALAGVAPSLEVGMTIIMIANFGMMFGGNVFWDVNSAPALRYIAHVLPISYLADLYRQVINHTSGLWPIWVDALALVAWTGLALVVAGKTFRFDMAPREYRAAPAL